MLGSNLVISLCLCVVYSGSGSGMYETLHMNVLLLFYASLIYLLSSSAISDMADLLGKIHHPMYGKHKTSLKHGTSLKTIILIARISSLC